MNKPIYYTPEQMDSVQRFIADSFGDGGEGMVGHEQESEYVHSDVAVVTTREGSRCFATFGMGARRMNAPVELLTRAELVMFASPKLALTEKEALVIAGELQHLSKFPFRNDTFLGPGHTVTASETFQKTFGFQAFALDLVAASDFPELGKILFLVAIPIYRQEREKMIEGNTFAVLEQLEEKFDERLYYADSHRKKL